MTATHHCHLVLCLACIAAQCLPRACTGESPSKSEDATAIVKETGVRNGLCVILGADAGLATTFAKQGNYLLQILDPDAERVEQARASIAGLGLYGDLLSARQSFLNALPYPNNLINLLVLTDPRLEGVAAEELGRVVRPHGVIWIRGGKGSALKFAAPAFQTQECGAHLKVTKLWPAGMDDWTHHHHGPDNNPVSNDQFAGPPFRVQWIGEPKRQVAFRHASRAVACQGRLFFSEYVGDKYKPNAHRITVLDAFNGFKLWTHEGPIAPEIVKNASAADGKTHFVATSDTLFNIAAGKGCQVFDAVTGSLKATYRPESAWTYLAWADGQLFGVAKDGFFAIDALSGKEIWKTPARFPLAIAGGRVFILNDAKILLALDARSGKELWKYEAPEISKTLNLSARAHGPCLYLNACGGLVLSAETGRRSTDFAGAEDKSAQWSQWLLFKDGVLGKGSKSSVVFDLENGKLKHEGRLLSDGCTRVTGVRDWVSSRHHNGVSMFNLKTKETTNYYGTRSSCTLGTVFANGLTFTLPPHCVCYYRRQGVVALSSAQGRAIPKPDENLATRFVKGPAYGRGANASPSDAAVAWPTARHDVKRTACSPQNVALPLQKKWKAEGIGKPTEPIASHGMVFVGTDRHQVLAYDAATGVARWSHPCGGAIHEALVIHEDLLLFGSNDGWVTCLQVQSGEVAWKFQAAPEQRSVPHYGVLRSSWPVSSGVMIDEGLAYFCAGQEACDGIYLYAVEPRTGKILWHNWSGGQFGTVSPPKYKEWHISSSGPMLATEKHLLLPSEFELPVFLDKKTGNMIRKGYGLGGGNRQAISGNALLIGMESRVDTFSEQVLRGGSYFVHEIEPSSPIKEGKPVAASRTDGEFQLEPPGKLGEVAKVRSDNDHYSPKEVFAQDGPIVVEGAAIYGTIWRKDGTQLVRSALAMDKKPSFKIGWVQDAPLLARAALLAGGAYFCAGDATPAGAENGRLLVMDKASGEKLQELALPGLPIEDGMCAAYGRIYFTTREGGLWCMGKE